MMRLLLLLLCGLLCVGPLQAAEERPAPSSDEATEAAVPPDVPIEQLRDLTGRASAIVTLKERDNFANEFLYDVTIRNQSGDSFVARSLILVLEQITDLAGKEALERMEVVGQDGETLDGKPYFRVPLGRSRILRPYSESAPATVRLRNQAYTIVFTPAFRVLGLPVPQPAASASVTPLVRLLIQKGLLTEEEWKEATTPSP